jgi:hypothetical protein
MNKSDHQFVLAAIERQSLWFHKNSVGMVEANQMDEMGMVEIRQDLTDNESWSRKI